MGNGEAGGSARSGFVVRGRVQGVGFRWWTERAANRLGVAGYVRNCRDGSVEVQACGTAEAVAELAEKLLTGPPGSRVDSMKSVDPDASIPLDRFEIRR